MRAREDPAHAPGHLRDPRVLPHQPDAGLLRLADRVQPARHRPLAAQLLLRQLLRLVRGQPPARVRPEGAAVPRVRVDGGRLQLPARAQGGARPDQTPRRRRQGRLRHVRRRDRGGGRGGRARGRAPVGRAAPPARLEDRHHPARQRGGRAERAEHARPRDHLRGADGARRVGRPRRRPRRPDPVRRLRQDDVLHQGRARLGPLRGRHGRPGAQGHEADQQPRGGGRGGADPPRHRRRAADDRPHRPPRADPAQGRLVRQRHLPRGAVARAPRARARADAEARRPARRPRATAASSRSTTSPTSTAASCTSARSTRASAA